MPITSDTQDREMIAQRLALTTPTPHPYSTARTPATRAEASDREVAMSSVPKRDVLVSGVQFDQELKSGAMPILQVAPAAKRLGAQGVEYREVYWKDKAVELPAVRNQVAQLGLKATYATFNTLFHRDPE